MSTDGADQAKQPDLLWKQIYISLEKAQAQKNTILSSPEIITKSTPKDKPIYFNR